jgi:hypothetical protein
MSRSLTVGQLIRQLQTLDPDLPVRLAVNPDWPFSHYAGRVVDADGTAFIAEDGQESYLPRAACTALDWLTDSDAPGAEPAPDSPNLAPRYLGR